MRILILFFLLPLHCFSTAQDQISFIEEYIDFVLDTSWFNINGVYTFTNSTHTPAQKNILFPFSIHTDSVDVVRMYHLTYGNNIDFKTLEKSILFRMEVKPLDTVSIAISYRQITKKENVYILQSTSAWGEPLQRAKYTLTVHNPVQIRDFSYPPDSLSGNVYYWEKTKFLPGKDFIVVIK